MLTRTRKEGDAERCQNRARRAYCNRVLGSYNPAAGASSFASLSPLKFWETHFARTLAEPRHHGKVHIMAVNNVRQYTLHETSRGEHWFLAAWFVEPPQGAAGAA